MRIAAQPYFFTFITALMASAAGSEPPMRLGVNTHFDQSWPPGALQQAIEANARSLRDTLTWSKVEHVKGQYDFHGAAEAVIRKACSAGMSVTLDISPQNKLYDSGMTVYSNDGVDAFARYVGAVSAALPCVKAIEIGNEINGDGGIKGPARQSMPQSYITILRAVRAELQHQKSPALLLGGSTNLIATGFLTKLFKAGMLPLVDGIVIHPYSDNPEFTIVELDQLREAMKAAGAVKPIWATEFGLYYRRADMAPSHALKMLTVLSAAGIAEADWYALLDEPWFPNMGLFNGAVPKPAFGTFRTAAQLLLPLGDAVRIKTDDPLSYIYRFGKSTYVMWGYGRQVRFSGSPQFLSASGGRTTELSTLTNDPFIVHGDFSFTLGPKDLIADSIADYGVNWSYFALAKNGQTAPMHWIHWTWTSFIGLYQGAPPLVMPRVVRPGAFGMIERFMPSQSGTLWLNSAFCQDPGTPAGSVTVRNGGTQIFYGSVGLANSFTPRAIDATAGKPINFEYRGLEASTMRREIRISITRPREAVTCPEKKL